MKLELGSSWAPAGLLWAPGSFAGVFMQLELDAVRLELLLGSCWAPADCWRFCRIFPCS